jgi:hypothetical protein
MDTLRYYIIPLITLTAVVGFGLGGEWVWLGAATFPVLAVFDILLPNDYKPRNIAFPWLADLALYLQLPLMIALYTFFIIGVRSGGINLLSLPQAVGCFLSIMWISMVPTLPVAHEFLHRRHWFPRRVAQILCTFFGDPNRDIGHNISHHIWLDTPKDSDTPRRGQTMYAFSVQATLGAYKDAIRHEAETLRRQGLSPWNWRNRNYQEVLLLAALLGIVWGFAGPLAALVTFLSEATCKFALEALNYFQHYGLVREEGAPVQIHHTWNHMGSILRPAGCEITNHINHHMDGFTPFYNLQPEPNSPQMPSLFICVILGIIPPLWFNLVAKPRLKDWDLRCANLRERELARAANKKAGWPLWMDEEASPGGSRVGFAAGD